MWWISLAPDGPLQEEYMVRVRAEEGYGIHDELFQDTALCLPLAAEGDDLLEDLRLFYCDTATFGESAANIQQVRGVVPVAWG